MKINKKYQNGFSLIEVILYIFLFSLMLGGSLSTFYYLMESNQKLSEKSLINDEAEFIISKIDGFLRNSDQILSPSFGEITDDLSMIENSGDLVRIFLEEDDLLLKVNNNPPISLNNSQIKIENLSFQSEIVFQAPPLSIINTSFSINGDEFKFSRYKQ